MALYVVAQSEQPVTSVSSFDEISETPHLTLLPRFTVEPEQVNLFVKSVGNLLENVSPLELKATGEDVFYSAQFQEEVPVALIENTGDLQNIHTGLLTALVEAGGSVDTPAFTGNGWTPHMSGWRVNDPVPTMKYIIISQSTMIDETLTTSIIAMFELS